MEDAGLSPATLDSVLQQYLAQVPLRSFSWPSFGDGDRRLASTTTQRQLAACVLRHPRAVAFPPAAAYTRQFLKQYLATCEGAGEEVEDELYEALAGVLSAAPSARHYQTYVVGPDRCLTVRASEHFIADGTTGLVTWPAAYRFAEWVLHCAAPRFADKRVLELGSGPGFLGMLLASCTAAAHITLTDCHSGVLLRLQENLHINGLAAAPSAIPDDPSECSSAPSGNDEEHPAPSVTVARLDWLDCSPATLDALRPDVVVCSDLAYDPDLFPALIAALRALLQHPGAIGLVASAVRNPATWADFLRHLHAAGLVYREVDLADVPPRFPCDRTATVILHEVYSAGA